MTNTIQRPHWLSRDSFDKLLDRVAPLPQCVQCKAIEDLTIDHIVPRYAGGNDDLSNLQIMCRSCNSRKGIRDDSYWAHHFYWDRLPAPEGLVHLREAQRQLFLAIDQDPYFERNASEIARLLYICAWVVGSGKTLGLAVAAWAYNNVIRRKWGRAVRRVDRILILCKEQAIRDQIAFDLPNDLLRYGIVTIPPRVHVVTDGDQFKQQHWLDDCDAVCCCIQQLWTKNNAPRPDLAAILARFALVLVDEPHFAADQMQIIIDAAYTSLCIGYTGSPIDRAGQLLKRMIALSVYDYRDAISFDRSLKYLSDDPGDLLKHVRVMNLQDAAISIDGQSAITTTTDHKGYDKNIEPAKAICRGVIEEIKARDELHLNQEQLAKHRQDQPNIFMLDTIPWAHAAIYFENIAIAEEMAKNTNEFFAADPTRYPSQLGYHVEVVHTGNSQFKAKPLARAVNDEPHPWQRCHRNGGKMDSKCARFCFFVGIGREGVNNPYCALTGVAVSMESMLAPIQGWIGRQLRAVIEQLDNGGIKVPPAPLDTVRIITHEAYANLDAIRRAIKFICDMRSHLAALPTIADLTDADPKPVPIIESDLTLDRGDKIDIVGFVRTREEITGQFPSDDEIAEAFAPNGGKRAELVRGWVDQIKQGDRDGMRKSLRLDRQIEPWVIVHRERLVHSPQDAELERFIRVHHPEHLNVLPITSDVVRGLVVTLYQQHTEIFQLPPIASHTTINTLCNQVGGYVKQTLGAYYDGPDGNNDPTWRYSITAVKRKLGVPPNERLRNGGDWDIPQCHAIVRNPYVQSELSGWVIARLIEEGLCPKLDALR